PLALALVDVDEFLERGFRERRAVDELGKKLLGAVEEPGAEVVLGEREHGLMPLRVVQVRTREQVLVDANRTLDLAAAPEQVPEREVRLERVLVDLCHLHEQLERLVRLPVQDEVETADVVGADARRQLAVTVDVDAIGEADRTERDEDRG